jgi:putative spermidine/putrescine transport system substrate-binding protein
VTERDPATAAPTVAPPTAEPVPTQEPIASPIASYLDPERWTGRTLTVASLGGDYQRAQDEAYFAPFTVDTGATVRQDTTVEADLRRQVDDEGVIWDVVCIATEAVLPLARARYLAPINYAAVDKSNLFAELGIAMQHGVAADLFSTAITYPAAATEIPRGWADFWDTGRFGEGRALKKEPIGTLEFALLADGVPIDQLYPLDVERAFASLDRIKPHVAAQGWYEDGKQPVELVVNGAVGLASAWNVRAALPDIRGQVGIQWAGGMLSADSWVVPRGAPNPDVAMDFVNYATRARPNANFCRLLPFGPVNREALALLRPDRLPLLPTSDANRAVQFVENWNYWVDNYDALAERFRGWLEAELESDGTEVPE